MKIGIVGYGTYIPKYRIKIEEIAAAWNQNPSNIKSSLLIQEKSVPYKDEDTATISIQAAQNAISMANINKEKIEAIFIGSESHPYAVKPTATIVGTSLNIGNNYMAADLEFACKAGTTALQICYGLVKADMIEYGLAIGADTAQAAPGDILEYSAAAGGAAFIIGKNEPEIIATIDHTISFSSNTPDFWRRNRQKYPSHEKRFTGEPSYFKHVITTTNQLLEKISLQPKDFDYIVFHQPNGKFPIIAAKKLGFSIEQLEPGLIVKQIGNTYSSSSMLSLAVILDQAKPNQKILVTSYGSGSGSDAFVITTTKHITKKQNEKQKVKDFINKK